MLLINAKRRSRRVSLCFVWEVGGLPLFSLSLSYFHFLLFPTCHSAFSPHSSIIPFHHPMLPVLPVCSSLPIHPFFPNYPSLWSIPIMLSSFSHHLPIYPSSRSHLVRSSPSAFVPSLLIHSSLSIPLLSLPTHSFLLLFCSLFSFSNANFLFKTLILLPVYSSSYFLLLL